MKLFSLTFIFWSWWWAFRGSVLADPEIRLLSKGCSQYNASNLSDLNENLNATLRDLRAQVSNQGKHFAAAQQAKGYNPVFALLQCRNYLSTADCLACFSAATVQIRNCSAGATGARVIYDGCFLR